MDSINAQQSEQNRDDLGGTDAIGKIKELVKQAPTCFFCTSLQPGQPFATRPMSVQTVDDAGHLWFLSASDSKKNQELARNPRVQLLFQGSAHSDFLTLEGSAVVSRNRDKIKELWQPLLKTWFTDGVEDPRITVLEVRPSGGYYWDTKHGRMVAFAKMAVGAMTGRTMDDSIEGRLKV